MANTKKIAGVGAGLIGAAAAAAAGYYFYATKDAKKNRKLAAKWATDLKRDVVREAKKLQNVDRAKMLKIVDTAATAYETVRSVDKKDLTGAVKELKKNWQELARELGVGAKGAKKKITKAVKKLAKPTPKRRR